MRPRVGYPVWLGVLLLLFWGAGPAWCQHSKPVAHDDNMKDLVQSNKFLAREASDDHLPAGKLDEEALAKSPCSQNVELRWQTEVSSSVYATPLIADINSDGKLEVVIPSFVHYLEALEGADGEKVIGFPAFHQSTVHASPLLYDIDKDGIREILLATFNGEVVFFRNNGYLMPEKLTIPRLRVRKDWFQGLDPDHVDRSHPDVHDEGIDISNQGSKSETSGAKSEETPVVTDSVSSKGHVDATLDKGRLPKNDSVITAEAEVAKNVQRRLLEDNENSEQAATVENDEQGLEEDAIAGFELLRDYSADDEAVTDEYNYDYDDYVDENMWGDEDWNEAVHEKEEDYTDVDAHILCTPVIADIDNDGVDEMIVASSFFYDREYYDAQEHKKELGDLDIGKYIACSVVVFNLETKQVKWNIHLDLSTDSGSYRAFIYSSPTVADIDGDGFLEIIVGTSFGFLYVLRHNGQVMENFPVLMGEIQGQVIAADINDDGLIEIVSVDTRGNVAAWNSKGKEIWERHLKSLISQGATVGDVNGDGHTEIVVPTSSGNIYVLKGADGSIVSPFPYRTHGRVMAPVLLVDLNKRGSDKRALTLAVTSFDGYFYLIDGATGCADAVDIGETSYSMVVADNVDGGDDLDLIVTTMNGNVLCFQTPSSYHPLKAWPGQAQGRNVVSSRSNRQGIFVLESSRNFRDEAGDKFWIQFQIVDEYRPSSETQGPYKVKVTMFVPGNYQGNRSMVIEETYKEPGVHKMRLPCLPLRTGATVLVEMTDKNGLYFYDEFSLTFHMRYYRLLKWLVILPLMGMAAVLILVRPQDAVESLPTFSGDKKYSL